MKQSHVGMSGFSILLFRLNGHLFGIDTQAIEGLQPMDEISDDAVKILKVHALLQIPDDGILYKAPKVLLLRETKPLTGIIVAEPEVMPRSVEVKTIQPLPHLVQPFAEQNALWGVCIVENEVILLFDPHQALYLRDTKIQIKEKSNEP